MPGSWSEAGMRAGKEVRIPVGWTAGASPVTASSRISCFVAGGLAARTRRTKVDCPVMVAAPCSGRAAGR